jgi:hypothetical protein
VRPQVVPLHEALDAPVGSGHVVHEVAPHELTLVFRSQRPPHGWLPTSHVPLQAAAVSMQAPRQSFLLAGHETPHAPLVQVADPPVGTPHAVHETPQVAVAASLEHTPLHRWKPAAHFNVHVPEAQSGEPLAPAAQATHAAPHAVASSSFAQDVAPHLCEPAPHVKSHFEPSQVAACAFGGTGQAVHAVPHELTS